MIFAAGSRLRGILKIPVIEYAEVVCEQNITGADQQQFPADVGELHALSSETAENGELQVRYVERISGQG